MKKTLKIYNVVGARPNFMKIAPVMEQMKLRPELTPILIHTGQHYDEKLSKVFFDNLGLPEPDINLGIGSGSHAVQTAGVMIEFEKLCDRDMPDLVLVVGDVNSTLACSLVAAKLCIPIAHVEAGLRSRDRLMPEEINRIVTDAISDYLFTTSKDADANLLAEGIPMEKIFFVGNVMVDTLLKHRDQAVKLNYLKIINCKIKEGGYALVTLHRQSNVDDRETLAKIVAAIEYIQNQLTVIFPVHPRTKKQLQKYGMDRKLASLNGLVLLEPLGYLDFLSVMSGARVVLTDSGGLQEETTVLGIPCLTIRENTERPVTVSMGTNQLVGTDYGRIISAVEKILEGNDIRGRIPELWDGRAAERIVDIIGKLV
ncbi:MAG: UDP-N-acetylglucosamine 2-epimerase [Gammaproteobacteria bacterium]|nr:UDP-N-acetylglucosamine 2-epimerase [Gammaproteobacteria bacterium]